MRTAIYKEKHKDARAGAALLIALGLLAVFSVLGAAYLQFALIASEEMDMRLQELRARQTAEGGVRAGLAKLLESPAPEQAAGASVVVLNVYGPRRVAAGKAGRSKMDMTAVLSNFRARARVNIEVLDPAAAPSGPAQAAVRAVRPGEGKLFRIVSDGAVAKLAGDREYGRISAHTEALLLLRADGHEWIYWNTGPGPMTAQAGV